MRIYLFIVSVFLISGCFMSEEPPEKPPLCDWTKKPPFGKCLEENFVGKDVSLIDDFLRSQRFTTLKGQEDPRYYRRTSNDLSGYKIAVIIDIAPDRTLRSIQIR